ncbi:MAG: SdpI family protein [Clostridia bacterium]|nr:SdpI family protein [Clostridia bacterium]
MFLTIALLLLVSTAVVPMLMLLAGWMMRLVADSEPNRAVGFRTRLSMSSSEAWRYANMYLGRKWGVQGLIMLGVSLGAVLVLLLSFGSSLIVRGAALSWIVVGVTAAQVLWMVFSCWEAERHLRTVFRPDGSRISRNG